MQCRLQFRSQFQCKRCNIDYNFNVDYITMHRVINKLNTELNVFKNNNKDLRTTVFVFASALYFGLNQSTFLFLFRKGFSWIHSNFRFLLKPLPFRTFSYKDFALLNSSSLMDNNERRCSPLYIAASKYLVGDLSWHLHKAGYCWVPMVRGYLYSVTAKLRFTANYLY